MGETPAALLDFTAEENTGKAFMDRSWTAQAVATEFTSYSGVWVREWGEIQAGNLQIPNILLFWKISLPSYEEHKDHLMGIKEHRTVLPKTIPCVFSPSSTEQEHLSTFIPTDDRSGALNLKAETNLSNPPTYNSASTRGFPGFFFMSSCRIKNI